MNVVILSRGQFMSGQISSNVQFFLSISMKDISLGNESSFIESLLFFHMNIHEQVLHILILGSNCVERGKKKK